MVQFELTILTLSVALGLFVVGVIFKKKAVYLALTGALILMIFGITAFANPIEFKTGSNTIIFTNTTTNITEETLVFNYAPQNPTQNLILAWTFMLLGLAGTIMSIIIMRNERFEDVNDGSFSTGEEF